MITETASDLTWTEQDNMIAFRNGWNVFEYDQSDILVILRIDDFEGFRKDRGWSKRDVKNVRRFRTDDGAYAFVKTLAKNGDVTAIKAIKLCPRQEDFLAGKNLFDEFVIEDTDED